jgi:ACS family pantothenate transporter-like MFS transporter
MTSKSEPVVQTTGLKQNPRADGVVTSTISTPEPSDRLQPYSRPRRILRTFQRYVWDDPDKPKDEKWFLLKLDFFLLLAACAGYFSKNLDQSNVKNAYVSGVIRSTSTHSKHVNLLQMKESLNMHGSELTYAGNCFTAGYVIGQAPAVMLATRIRPSILIPTLEILWSVMTFCTSSVTNVSHLYAIRFLIGLCESGYFPVMIVSLDVADGSGRC